MNKNEYQRLSMPALPDPGGNDSKTALMLLNEAIHELYKRDADKERRIRELENQ